jgi:cobalt-zinc-cadmium resistance protein CzcA
MIVVALGSLKFIGTEFMPKPDEGSLVITSKRLPGISLTESIKIGQQIERAIKSFPEVQTIVTKLGRPDLATEAMGEYESDSYVSFTPKFQEASTKKHKDLSSRIEAELNTIPGVSYEFTQPMEMRMDETITGTRGAVALKIFAPENGGDLDTLERLGHQANKVIGGVDGASETQMELISGAEELQILLNRDLLAPYGLSVAAVQEFVESMYGGKSVSEMLDGEQRFAIAVRLPSTIRNDAEALRSLELKTPDGSLVQLDEIAQIKEMRGPILINRENAQRRAVVTSNVEGRDLGSFVDDCKKAVAAQIQLPAGYRLEWGGQYENQHRSTASVDRIPDFHSDHRRQKRQCRTELRTACNRC